VRQLGVVPELTLGDARGREPHASCFAAATAADGTVSGRKLVGSAQARRRGVLLQHGSLLIEQDAAAWEALFGPGNQATTLAELLGVVPSRTAIHAALIRGFEQEFGILLHPGTYHDEEWDAARLLADSAVTEAAGGRSTAGTSHGMGFAG
jgi:lipoate-protein ligase A